MGKPQLGPLQTDRDAFVTFSVLEATSGWSYAALVHERVTDRSADGAFTFDRMTGRILSNVSHAFCSTRDLIQSRRWHGARISGAAPGSDTGSAPM